MISAEVNIMGYPHRIKRVITTFAFCTLAMTLSVLAAEAEDILLEEVLVTGTRIRDAEPSTIVYIMDSEAIAYTGSTNIMEIVGEIGALAGSDTEAEISSGENFLNLRNLGISRTLTLVDGHRFVSGFNGGSAVDTNVIPVAFTDVACHEVVTVITDNKTIRCAGKRPGFLPVIRF